MDTSRGAVPPPCPVVFKLGATELTGCASLSHDVLPYHGADRRLAFEMGILSENNRLKERGLFFRSKDSSVSTEGFQTTLSHLIHRRVCSGIF